MRKVFLDCGAWTGCSARKAKDVYKGYEIYSFEADPRNYDSLDIEGVTLIKCAVSDTNGIMKLYLGETQSNSLYREKKTGGVDKNNYIEVESIDLAEWIGKNLNKDDQIILKLNIEGSEYEVIEKMHKSGVLDWINTWHVEWHWKKVGVTKERHDKVASMIHNKKWTSMTDKKYNE